MPSDVKPKSAKPTITLDRKAATGTNAPNKPFVDRKFSTRAKDAARRDGRTLFEPVAESPANADGEDDAGVRRRRSTEPGAGNRTGRSTEPGAGNRSGRSTEPGAGNRSGRSTDTNAASRRPAEARGKLQGQSDGRRSTEPRRGGKMRDQRIRDDSKPAVPASPPREPDGMVRVSKLLSEQGLCSRREADSYIARGWVLADDVRVTELGTRVLPTAKLTLDREAEAMQEMRMTILINKPVGYVSGQAEDGYQPASVLAVAENQLETDEVRFHPEHRRGLAPAGRLDIDSTGLLVLTQDGRIAKQLIGENSEVDKEYLVRVEGKISAADLKRLNHGLSLDGEVLKPAIVKWQNEDQLNFILREGKKRQIRRMCEAVGLTVTGLKRIRIGKIKLGDLPVGKWRFLAADESF